MMFEGLPDDVVARIILVKGTAPDTAPPRYPARRG